MFKQVSSYLQYWRHSPRSVFPSEVATSVVPDSASTSKREVTLKNMAAVSPAPVVAENPNAVTDENRNRSDSDGTKSVSVHESPPRTPTVSSHDSAEEASSSGPENQKNRLSVNRLLYPKRASIEEFIAYLRHHRADRSIVREWLRPLTNSELRDLREQLIDYPEKFHNQKKYVLLEEGQEKEILDHALDNLLRIAEKKWRNYSQENTLQIWTKEEKNQYLLNCCLQEAPSSFIHITRYHDLNYMNILLASEPFQAAYFAHSPSCPTPSKLYPSQFSTFHLASSPIAQLSHGNLVITY